MMIRYQTTVVSMILTMIVSLLPPEALSGQSQQMRGAITAEVKKEAEEMHEHHMHTEGMPPKSALKPAEGARIKIIAPQEGEVCKGDEIPIGYKWVKGKRGHHLHAYVDGELMGMFSHPKKGILTGIQPGRHTLELRVVAEDHQTELDATDSVHFAAE
jgi:hypothetical protein